MAEEGIREIGLTFMVLAGISAFVGMSRRGAAALIDGLILAALAFTLYLTKSRIAAVILLAVAVLNANLFFPRFIPFVWRAFALRATQLTFGYHRLKREARRIDEVF